MKIHVPEDLGGELRLLPPDVYSATLVDIFGGHSKDSGQPKATFKWTITSECTDPGETQKEDYVSTIGETLLDTYSLQPQALWRLNDTFKALTGEDRIPQGDYDLDEFIDLLKEKLVSAEARLLVQIDTTPDGRPINRVEEIS